MSNVTILKELPVPEGAPPSETPLAETVLGGFPRVRDHYAERDVLATLEGPPVIITAEASARWAALDEDVSDAAESGRLLLADWWRHGWAETFQKPPFWAEAPAARPYVPAAPVEEAGHPYPPVPVAEPVRQPADVEAGLITAEQSALSSDEGLDHEPVPVQDEVPADTQVIPVDKAETEAIPKVKDEGGEDS